MKLSKTLKNLIVVLVSAAAVFYIGIWFLRTFSTDVGTEHTGLDTVERKLDATGYLLRAEKLLQNSVDGVVYYIADEGEKVSKDSIVANIYESESLANTQSQILEIERKIKILEDSAIDKNNTALDISKLDQQISESIINIRTNVANHKYKLSADGGDQLLTVLNKRQLLSQKAYGYDDIIARLDNEKNNLAHSMTGLKTTISTDEGGYFTSALDGYENIFTLQALNEMTVDSFEKLLTQKPDESVKNNGVGKIITSYWWYILCPVDKSSCTGLEAGENYELVFPYSSDQRINFVLDKKLTQTDNDTAVLVFKTLAEPEDFDFTRQQEVQIIEKSYTGLKIPKSSLRILDGQEGVYVLKGSEVVFKRVERIFENESCYLIEPTAPENRPENQSEDAPKEEQKYAYLALYDAVITRGKDLYDGKVVK